MTEEERRELDQKKFNCNKAPEDISLVEILQDHKPDDAGMTTLEYGNMPLGLGPKVPVNVLDMCLNGLEIGQSAFFWIPIQIKEYDIDGKAVTGYPMKYTRTA